MNENNNNQNNYQRPVTQNNGIVRPSMNPGYQVNNSFNNYNKQISEYTSSNKNVDNSNKYHSNNIKQWIKIPVIILIIIIGIFGIISIGKHLFNSIALPTTAEKTIDNINESKLFTLKSSAQSYFDNIEYYAALSSYSDISESSSVNVPMTKNGIIKCSKINSEIWSGEVLTTSSSCDDFMNAVESTFKGLKPNEGEVIFNTNGIIQNDSYLVYDNIICKYNSALTCEVNNSKKSE